MKRFVTADDWRVRRQREVNAWERHQVCLKLGQVDVESAVEAQRRRDGRDDLTNDAIQAVVRRALDVQVPSERNNNNKNVAVRLHVSCASRHLGYRHTARQECPLIVYAMARTCRCRR